MLDKFLEYEIRKKLQLYRMLRASNLISIKSITKTLKSSESGTRRLIDNLNNDFKGLAKIEKKQQFFSLLIHDNVNTLKLLHYIYRDSTVLQCLKFMITNDTCKPFSDFTKGAFVSKSSAYRIKKVCQEYLQSIGLEIGNNKVIGEEYRIRFLIALLYYKYGIDCCNIDDKSIKLARKFILSTNQVIDLNFLESTVNEYGYFECLLILSWKRKSYPLFFKKTNDLQKLKKSFIYRDMRNYLKETVEITLNIDFSEDDYDYIYLAYCNTNSCVLADKWTQSDIDQIHQIVFGHTILYDLLQRFACKFGKNMAENHAMRVALIYFYKKFLFELQCISPDTYFYLNPKKDPLTLKVFHHVTELLSSWKKHNGIQYPINNDHIYYLSVQTESILRQFMNPVHLIIMSDLVVELEVMKLILVRSFSTQRVTITQILLNTQKMEFLYSLKDCVIIVNQKFRNIMIDIEVSNNNIIVPVTVEINSFDMNAIQRAIAHYEEKTFLRLINDI